MQRKEQIKLATFFSLYIAQSIPMSFFSTVIPVLMRQQEFSLTTIGLLQLIKLPWLIKFLWSPIVDRNTHSMKSYKQWIVSSEVCYALLILMVSLLNIHTDMFLIAILIVASFFASATQDIATDALAARCIDGSQKSMVNSMQSMGNFAGTLVGSGVLLLLYKRFGWSTILPLLALFVLLALLPLISLKKSDLPDIKRTRARPLDFVLFFKQRSIYPQVGFLALVYSGLIGILSMLRPLLVDMGYTIQEIGFMSGIVGTFTGFCLSFVGGKIIKRVGMYRSRIFFACVVCLSALYFYLISLGEMPLWQLYVGIALCWGGYGMSAVGVYTSSMERVREGREGTDFTIQTVLTHLSGMVVAIVSGRFAQAFGYSQLFLASFCLAALTVVYIVIVFKKEKRG